MKTNSLEKRLWQIIERKPSYGFKFFRFHNFWLFVCSSSKAYVNIVLSVFYNVAYAKKLYVFNFNPKFFFCFSFYALFWGFAKFKMAAACSPCPVFKLSFFFFL